MSSDHLRGRVVLVTGAAGGMGGAIARRLAADGATVIVNDRVRTDRLEDLAAEIAGHAAVADVADAAALRAAVAEVENTVGAIDVLVANHAAMIMGPMEESDPIEWWSVVDTNLGGTFNLIQAVLPGMRRRGGGHIVIISSEWGLTGWPLATAYSASKAGLIALAKTLGRELAPEGIVVNAVAPGVIDTPQLEVDAAAAGVTRADIIAEYAGQIPMGRVGQPEEIAALVSLLADPRLSAMVGQTVSVNGGSTRGRA